MRRRDEARRRQAVAFRADFEGAVPAPDERYWRGPVYEAYDGAEWTQVVMVTGFAWLGWSEAHRFRALPPG